MTKYDSTVEASVAHGADGVCSSAEQRSHQQEGTGVSPSPAAHLSSWLANIQRRSDLKV